MRPNLPFLSTASNALLKPGGLLRWKVRLVKDARLSLPLTEVMKIARLTFPPLDVPRQSLPRPRRRHGRQGITFPFLSQRPCVAEPEATSLSSAEPCALWSLTCPFALPFLLRNFLRLPPTSPHPLPLVQTKLPIPCQSTFLALAWIYFFTSSIFLGLHIPFLPSGRHLLLFPYTRWESLSTLLLPSGLSLSPPAYQSCLNASFYPVFSFFLESNSILSPRQAGFRPGQSTLDQILYLSQSISDGFNKPRPGSRTILSTIDFFKAFGFVWHPAHFHKPISAGLPPCFARWTQSFLSDRRTSVVFQNHKSRSFRVRRGVPQGF